LLRKCDISLESLLNGVIGGKFTSRKGAISTQRARSTAIAGPLVNFTHQMAD